MKKIGFLAVSIFLFFLLVGLWFKGQGYDNQFYILVSVSGALFGIFVAFSIYGATTRMSKIDELLKSDEAYLQSIYVLSSAFGNNVQAKTRTLIDSYLIAQLDYTLADFRYSGPSFYKLEEYLIGLKPKNNRELATYQNIESDLASSASNRKTVESLVNQKISGLEWASIVILYLLISFFLLDLNTSRKLLPAVLTSALLTAIFLLLALLREIDLLRWQENNWIWQPVHDLFTSLDLVPYYPSDVLQAKRVQIPQGSRIRVAYYPDPYPNFSNKQVEIIQT